MQRMVFRIHHLPVLLNMATTGLKCTGACRLAKITITNEKPTAVAGVAESKAEVKKVVKVITANGIQIGNYNIAGQQVK